MKMARLEPIGSALTLRLPASARPANADAARGPLDAPVASVMRFPTVVTEATPLARTAELLIRPGVTVVVVVDERRRPLGVVTPTDALALARRLSPSALDTATALDAARSGGRFMPETSSLGAVHAALLDENRDFFVVVGPDGRLAGLVTAMDVLQVLQEPPPSSGTRLVGS